MHLLSYLKEEVQFCTSHSIFSPGVQKSFYWKKKLMKGNLCSTWEYSSLPVSQLPVGLQNRHRWKVKESEVAQSCRTLCNSKDYSLPGSSVHGIFQARVLEWGAIAFSRGSSWLRDRTRVCRITGRRFTLWATREAHGHRLEGHRVARGGGSWQARLAGTLCTNSGSCAREAEYKQALPTQPLWTVTALLSSLTLFLL